MYTNENYPAPRPEVKGYTDPITAPEATINSGIVASGAAIATPIYTLNLAVQWTPLQLGLIALMGFDLVGGVITNATSSAKSWFHRPGQTWQQQITFVGLHFTHILLVALLLRGGDWALFFGVSGYLLSASLLILGTPLYLQRPVAFGLCGLALLGDRYLYSPTVGLEWFLPLFFLKILVSHLLREVPYQPE